MLKKSKYMVCVIAVLLLFIVLPVPASVIPLPTRGWIEFDNNWDAESNGIIKHTFEQTHEVNNMVVYEHQFLFEFFEEANDDLRPYMGWISMYIAPAVSKTQS